MISRFDCVQCKRRGISHADAEHAKRVTVEVRPLLDSQRVVNSALCEFVSKLDRLAVTLEHPAGDAFIHSGDSCAHAKYDRELRTPPEHRRGTNELLRRRRQSSKPREDEIAHRGRHFGSGRGDDLCHEERVSARRAEYFGWIEARRLRHLGNSVETQRRHADLTLHPSGDVAQRATQWMCHRDLVVAICRNDERTHCTEPSTQDAQ